MNLDEALALMKLSRLEDIVEADLKDSWRREVKRCHPDVGGSHEKMTSLIDAKTLIANKIKEDKDGKIPKFDVVKRKESEKEIKVRTWGSHFRVGEILKMTFEIKAKGIRGTECEKREELTKVYAEKGGLKAQIRVNILVNKGDTVAIEGGIRYQNLINRRTVVIKSDTRENVKATVEVSIKIRT